MASILPTIRVTDNLTARQPRFRKGSSPRFGEMLIFGFDLFHFRRFKTGYRNSVAYSFLIIWFLNLLEWNFNIVIFLQKGEVCEKGECSNLEASIQLEFDSKWLFFTKQNFDLTQNIFPQGERWIKISQFSNFKIHGKGVKNDVFHWNSPFKN